MTTGSGTVTRETRELRPFRAVELRCQGDLTLEQGDPRGIEIEAEDNILPLIETFTEGDCLVIRFERGLRRIRPTRPIRFRTATPELRAVEVSGSGSVYAPSVVTDALDLEVSGSGRLAVDALGAPALDTRISGSGHVHLEGSVDRQQIRISGSGDYRAAALDSRLASAAISGSGSASVRVREQLDADISGSGSVRYIGQPEVHARTSGSGRVRQEAAS
jgi:hypothetical protein